MDNPLLQFTGSSYQNPAKKKKNPLLPDEEDSIIPFTSKEVAPSNNPLVLGATIQPNFQSGQQTAQQAKDQPSLTSQLIGAGIADKLGTPYNQEAIQALYPVSSFIAGTGKSVLDLLSTPLHGSAKFFDSLIDNKGDIIIAFGDSITEFIKSVGKSFDQGEVGDIKLGANPDNLTYSDVIKKQLPTFAKNYPIATSVLGFVGDVAFDPTTYVSFGSETGIKLAGQKLSNKGIDLVRELNTTVRDGIQYTIKNAKTGAEHIGYLGIDDLNLLKKTTNIVELAQGSLSGDQAALGQLNTILNTRTKGIKGKLISVNELTPAQRTWEVEQNFNAMVKIDPKLTIAGGDTGLFLDLPFTPKRITVIPPSVVDSISDKLGITKVMDGITENLRKSKIVGAFSRNYPLETEQDFIKLRDAMYGQQNVVDHSIRGAIQDFVELPPESRKRLAELAVRIDERISTKKAQVLAQTGNDTLAPKAVSMTRAYALNKAVTDGTIDNREFLMFGRFLEAHNKMAEQELLSKMFGKTADRDLLLADKFNPKNAKDLDIAVLHALKLKAAGYAQAQKDFDLGVTHMYGLQGKSFADARTIIPDNVKRDLDYIGTSFYSKYNDAKHPVLNAIGTFNNVFKTLAYGVRPFAAVKQYFGNTLQASTKVGARAFKSWIDPRSLVDAAMMTLDNSAYAKYIPQELIDTIKNFETPVGKMIYAIDHSLPVVDKNVSFTTRLGEQVTGEQMRQELMRNDIYHKGLDILDLEQTKNLRLQIAKQNGYSAFQKEKWHEGFGTFMRESIPWINLPSHVENINRTATYINARKLGYLEDQASELTKKALFDYAHGTTQFENEWMKRLVPFYSFQRFAIPLIGSLVKEPGKLTTLNKTTKEFFEVYSKYETNESLTDSERKVIPGWLLEQPHVFAGFDRTQGGITQGVFRTFNSYNFMDWLSLLETDGKGKIDFSKTVQKMSLAQITPILKVPLELTFDKNFFTGQPISKGGKIATNNKLTSIDAVKWYEENIPEAVQKLMQYEVQTDQQTGERRGYINPYLTYTMSSFAPFINDYINISKDDMNPREAAMRLIGGIGTVKLDFQKEQRYRINDWKDEIKQYQRDYAKAIKLNNVKRMNEDQEKIQIIIKKMTGIANLNVNP